MIRFWFCLAALSLVMLVTGVAIAQETQEKGLPQDFEGWKDQPSACDAVMDNLVRNCGFETGTFANWTQSGDLSFTGISGPPVPHTGGFGAFFGPIQSLGYISQMLPTTPGQAYEISFWLRNVGMPNRYQVYWGGDLISDQMNVGDFPYMRVSVSPQGASSAMTELKFGFFNVPDYFWLDDIVVIPCPPE